MRQIPDEEVSPVGLISVGVKLPVLPAVILISTSFVYAAGVSVAEKKAIRREMIEMDVAVRNLTSIIATSDKKMLEDSLERLITWQIKDHPEHGKNFRSVLGKWETKGALKFGKQIQAEANAMRGYVQGRAKFAEGDWKRVVTGFNKILAACQGCHDITRKDENP